MNTFIPLIVPKFLAVDAFFIFLMVQFIRGMPASCTRRPGSTAADTSGCSPGCDPAVVPALATTAIFTFIWSWSDFFGPLIYLTDPNSYTVPSR